MKQTIGYYMWVKVISSDLTHPSNSDSVLDFWVTLFKYHMILISRDLSAYHHEKLRFTSNPTDSDFTVH